MPIKGLTDKQRSDILGRTEIKVFKGARKGERSAGKDLGSKLRITTTNRLATGILGQYYGSPDTSGDFHTEELRIYLAFNEPDDCFKTSMQAYSISSLEVVCDRHTISKRCKVVEDGKGNKWRSLQEVEEPCPLRDSETWSDCPYMCQKNGELSFFVSEIMDEDLMIPARIVVHGFQDIQHLSARLELFKEELGSLTHSPFPSHWTRHKIPFVLFRTEVKHKRPIIQKQGDAYLRTGKRTEGSSWLLDIRVDPVWMDLYRKWQLVEEMSRRGLKPSDRAIAGLLSGDKTVDIEAIVVMDSPLPALPEVRQTITQEDWQQLDKIFKKHGWLNKAVVLMLSERFGIKRAGELLVSQKQEVGAIASNLEEAAHWNELCDF